MAASGRRGGGTDQEERLSDLEDILEGSTHKHTKKPKSKENKGWEKPEQNIHGLKGVAYI